MSIDDLLRDLAEAIARVPDSAAAEARAAYLRACRHLDEHPAEQQRIDDIAGLLDAEETLYAHARAAADRGDTDSAIPLLRKCAEAGTGEAAWFLAQLLEAAGDTTEAAVWYQHASDDGDNRAHEKLATIRARQCPHMPPAASRHEDHAGQILPNSLITGTSDLSTRQDRVRLVAPGTVHIALTDGDYELVRALRQDRSLWRRSFSSASRDQMVILWDDDTGAELKMPSTLKTARRLPGREPGQEAGWVSAVVWSAARPVSAKRA